METRTRIVLLMHPMEWRREKCTTGRLVCLNLSNSEIIVGLDFDTDARVGELIGDRRNYPVLLYPGPGARDLSSGGLRPEELGGRRLVVFLVDATWQCSRSIIRASPGLSKLPRMMFVPRAKSRWIIKRQPAESCLSTLEAVHELLLSLEESGLEAYPDKERLLAAFSAMQDYQVKRAAEGRDPRAAAKGRRAARDSR